MVGSDEVTPQLRAGRALARQRHGAGLSQAVLAGRIGYSRSTVAGVESGHQTASADFWQRCDDALASADALVLTYSRLRSEREPAGRRQAVPVGAHPDEPLSGWEYAGTWTEAIAIVTDAWSQDLSRRVLVEGSVGITLLATPLLRWTTRSAEQPAQGGSEPVTEGRIDALRAVTAGLRALDNRFGGAYVRPAVLAVLSQQVAPLLREGSFDSVRGRQLLSAAAELTQLLAWTTHDVGRHALAQQYLVQALRLAHAGGDSGLGAEILAAMSHQASFVGQGVVAVDVARVAQRTAADVGLAALIAEAHVMEAHGQAVQGDEHACTAAMNQAERWFAQAAEQQAPGWMGYFDEAYYSAKVGHCLRALGRLKAAEGFAERSLRMDTTYVRGHAFNIALLASICARNGDVDRAAVLGAEAVEVSRAVDSRRMDSYLLDLRADLKAHGQQADVKAFFALTQDLERA